MRRRRLSGFDVSGQLAIVMGAIDCYCRIAIIVIVAVTAVQRIVMILSILSKRPA